MGSRVLEETFIDEMISGYKPRQVTERWTNQISMFIPCKNRLRANVVGVDKIILILILLYEDKN